MPLDVGEPSEGPGPSGQLPSGAGPLELTRLIGRTREVQELLELMRSGRLVTLTGAGGSGKTRLALEVAGRLGDEGVPVGWVELASLDDPLLLSARILDSVGVRATHAAPDPTAAASALGRDPLVLVLDNCEHLVDACAAMVEGLLRAHPLLRILATSREALGVRGERAWLVPPLSLPPAVRSAEDAAGSEAVELFVDRARDVRADFRLTDGNAASVAEICARLDGIPLAIELAAARVRVLSPEQIRDRLDDAFRLLSTGARTAIPRHRTLQAAFQWSYDLLPPGSRVLLHRLSVFRGGFTLEAAEAVASDGDPGDPATPSGAGPRSPGGGDPGAPGPIEVVDVLEGISRLADRSMVQMRVEEGQARYHFLETIRQYAARKLAESGEEDRIRERHGRYMLSVAEAAALHIFGGRGAPGWMERLEQEDANLRAALDWALSDRSEAPAPPEGAGATPAPVEIGVRLATALLWYWFAQGRFAEGRAHLARGLALEASVSAPIRARARIGLAHLAFWQGEHGAVGGPAREGLAELEGTEDPHWRALGLIALGMAAHLDGRSDEAAAPLDEALALVRPLAHSALTVFALYWKGVAAQGRGDRALAKACLEEAGALGAASGHPTAAAHPLTVLGRLLLAEGDLVGARDRLARGLARHQTSRDRWGMVLALEGVAGIAAADGRLDDAVRILAGVEALLRTMDAVPLPADRIELDRTLESAGAALGPGRVRQLLEEGASLALEDLMALAGGVTEDPSSLTAPSAPGLEGSTPGAASDAAVPVPAQDAPSSPSADGPGEKGLRVRALGPLEVELDGRSLDPEVWSYNRPRELLVYLLLKPRGGNREEIATALWPDSTPAQARNSFHVTLHHLRKGLGQADRVVLDGDRYRLAPDLPVSWDGGDFEEGLRGALEDGRKGPTQPDRVAALLALYRGELLEGQKGARWLEEARDRFRRLRADGHLFLARTLLAEGDPDGAVREYEAVIEQEELNEEAHRGLMSAWARAGKRDRSLRQFQRLSVILHEIFEAEPEEETRALHCRILEGEERVTAPAEAVPDSVPTPDPARGPP